MKLVALASTGIVLCAGGYALAQPDADANVTTTTDVHPDFVAADTNRDGLLSIEEMQMALPDVEITDKNADGFVNQSEAEAAIEGLAFETNGFTGGSSLVSEAEYGLIVSSLDDDAARPRPRAGASSVD